MNSSKALGTVLLTTAIGWFGFSVAELIFEKVPASASTAAEVAMLTVASAGGNHDTLSPSTVSSPVSSPTVGPDVTRGESLPDPIAVGPAETEPTPASEAAREPAAPVEFADADLLPAVEQGTVEVTFHGNGRDRMTAKLRNNSPTPMRVSVAAGQVLEGGRNRVIVTRAATAELMPAQTAVLNLATAALYSTNVVAESAYKLSYQDAERAQGFIEWAAGHPGISTPAIQTVVLALTENPPLRALAKFAAGTAGSHQTDAFRVETGDLIAALNALRDYGGKLETFAIAQDPQLRIEAMIEPLSRESAKRFYGISEAAEWDFWRHELLDGSPSTRHYALFGIARFYPDVALEMLPKWAREPQTHMVFRLAALQALADTQRAEALPILRTLAGELGATTELGKAATQSANYLDKRLNELANRPQIVAFRDRSPVRGL
jgi:hypothetical protein